jgi:Mg2+/Co2+ transporter CorB
LYENSVVNIGATAIVTEAATAMFGEAGVSAATGVMTVCLLSHTGFLLLCKCSVI